MKRAKRPGATILLTALFAAQLSATLPALPSPAQTSAPTQPPLRLTLQGAIQRGMQKNLRTLLAGADLAQAEATSRRARALLLPKVRGETSAKVQNRSLRAFGITGPGIPKVVGPFLLYDFRAYVTQPLFDLSALHLGKASKHQEEAARLSVEDARSVITRLVSQLYLSAQAARARTEAAQSRVATAEALVKLARDRRDEGVATGVDLLRAEVSLANVRQRLLEEDTESKGATLQLARAIGVSLTRPIELAEPLAFIPHEVPHLATALTGALIRRADYKALQAQRKSVLGEIKSVRAKRLPRVDLRADIGGLGRNLGELDTTGTVQALVTVSLFDRDRGGEIAQMESRLRKIEFQIADLRAAIEEGMLEALLRLNSAAAQIEVSRRGRELAERELELARIRFETGVANNIEVTTAQESVARAQENTILALTRHADARAALARALGQNTEGTTP